MTTPISNAAPSASHPRRAGRNANAPTVSAAPDGAVIPAPTPMELDANNLGVDDMEVDRNQLCLQAAVDKGTLPEPTEDEDLIDYDETEDLDNLSLSDYEIELDPKVQVVNLKSTLEELKAKVLYFENQESAITQKITVEMILAGDNMLLVQEKSDKMSKLLESVRNKKSPFVESIEETVKSIHAVERSIPKVAIKSKTLDVLPDENNIKHMTAARFLKLKTIPVKDLVIQEIDYERLPSGNLRMPLSSSSM
ncbi:hypothetical protein BGZ76_004106 [Entomortierella beljakovae]|nr:hypothetical protein BGZ76_004106 [Entomortierella beljakovae]